MTLGLAIWLICAAATAAAWTAAIRNAQTSRQDPDARAAIAEMHHYWQTRDGRAATLMAIAFVWPVFAWVVITEAIKRITRRAL